jgi:hypothetical protein
MRITRLLTDAKTGVLSSRAWAHPKMRFEPASKGVGFFVRVWIAKMTDEEFHSKMFPPSHKHSDNCDWHLDQYWCECTCGLIPVADLKAEAQRRHSRAF